MVLFQPLLHDLLLFRQATCMATPLDTLSFERANEPLNVWLVFGGMWPGQVVCQGLGADEFAEGSEVLAAVVAQYCLRQAKLVNGLLPGKGRLGRTDAVRDMHGSLFRKDVEGTESVVSVVHARQMLYIHFNELAGTGYLEVIGFAYATVFPASGMALGPHGSRKEQVVATDDATNGGSTHMGAIAFRQDDLQLVLGELRVELAQCTDGIDDRRWNERWTNSMGSLRPVTETSRTQCPVALLPLEEATLGNAEMAAGQDGIVVVCEVVVHPGQPLFGCLW